MLTVHHLNQSRSKRILWLLEELEMPYKRIDYQRDANTHMAPESLKEVHPLGKAPVMVDGDAVLCESSVVMEFIINQDEQHRLRPAQGSAEYYQYLEWSHFAEGSLGVTCYHRSIYENGATWWQATYGCLYSKRKRCKLCLYRINAQ